MMLTKKGDKRTKPQWPPVRPLRRLEISAQHTVKYLETHPTAWLWRAGRRQGRKAELEETGFRCLPLQGGWWPASAEKGRRVMQARRNIACVLGKGGVCRRAEGEGRCCLLQLWVVTLVNLPPSHGSDVALCKPARARAMLGRRRARQGQHCWRCNLASTREPCPLLPHV